MKLKTLLYAVLSAFLLVTSASAVTAPHYEVTLSGAITSQVTFTGTSGTVHTTPFNSTSIIKQVLALNPSIKSKKDVALVYDPVNDVLDVINITDPSAIPTPLYTIVVEGSNFEINGVIYTGKPNKLTGVSTLSDVEITFPAASDTFICDATSNYSYNAITNIPVHFTIHIAGNNPNDNAMITATIKKASRVFNF